MTTIDKLTEQFTSFLLNFALAAVVTLAGYLFVRFVLLKLFRRLMRRYDVDIVFVKFVEVVVNVFLMSLVIIIALDMAGVETGYLIAALAAILIALLATMQGWLQNVAGGLWMFLNDPFKLDDLVDIAGKQGKVEEISLLTTKLRTLNNSEIILPNRTIVSNIITNFHANPERRIELVVPIAYKADIEQAISVIHEVLDAEERVLPEPKPIVAVASFDTNGMKLDVRPWVKKADFLLTRYALRKNIKLALDANHVAIPYQQIQLHTSD